MEETKFFCGGNRKGFYFWKKNIGPHYFCGLEPIIVAGK